MPHKVTLHDVADLAHVALGTASQALSGRRGVTPQTRRRVIQAARQLGYDQRLVLPGHKPDLIKTIGIIQPEDCKRHELDPIIAGVERACQKFDLAAVYAPLEVDTFNRVVNLPPNLTNLASDGLLVIGASLDHEQAHRLAALRCPLVMVEGSASSEPFDHIQIDYFNGAYQAVSYVIGLGHSHVGLLGWSENPRSGPAEGRVGYLKALADHCLPETSIENSLAGPYDSYAAALALMQKFPHLTAIFACSDSAANGVLAAAHNLGRKVPDSLSVVSLGENHFSQPPFPRLTTAHANRLYLGELAVRQLIYRTEDPAAPTLTTLVGMELIVGQSTCPPPGFPGHPEITGDQGDLNS